MATSNHINKVAIVGAGGNVGSFITASLFAGGKHTITALTRASSTSTLSSGVIIKHIDYEKPETIVEALKGQDALVITLGGFAPKDTDTKLIEAAAAAGVKWILPNEWAPDTANEGLVRDVFVFSSKPGTRKAITDLGKSNYIAVSTGFWYEWSLAIGPALGFDFKKREVTLFDEGETKISTSTWPQVGRAVAALLSLPIKAEGSASLENFANKVVYVSSFTISQREMLASVLRVTGTKESDWKVSKQPSKQRYEEGIEEMGQGKRVGMAKLLYTRVFYPDGSGDTEHGKGTINEVLGLEKENLDEATKRAVERSESVDNWTD